MWSLHRDGAWGQRTDPTAKGIDKRSMEGIRGGGGVEEEGRIHNHQCMVARQVPLHCHSSKEIRPIGRIILMHQFFDFHDIILLEANEGV